MSEKFYIQTKPTMHHPERAMVTKSKYLKGMPVSELLEIINAVPKDAKEIYFNHYTEYNEYVDEQTCDGASIRWKVLEGQEAYEKRVASFNKRLAEWEKWYQENKEKVDAINKHQAIIEELRAS